MALPKLRKTLQSAMSSALNGPALLAGLAYGWLQAMPFNHSVRFGSACAALTVQSPDNTHAQLSLAAVQALRAQFPD